MRQRDDQPFATAFNKMASGQMSDDISLLRTRISDESQVPNYAIHLCSSNQDADRYNMEKLSSIPTDQLNSEAIDLVKSAQLSLEQRNKCLEQTRTLKTSENINDMGNADMSDALVNGATGVLR